MFFFMVADSTGVVYVLLPISDGRVHNNLFPVIDAQWCVCMCVCVRARTLMRSSYGDDPVDDRHMPT